MRPSQCPSFPLPYPTINASTIEQAQGSFVLWNRNDVSLYKHGIPYIQNENERKTDTREGWVNEKVNLWSSNFTQIVAEGYILLASPNDAFEFGELGEDHVGVIVSKSHAGLNNALQIEQGLHDCGS